MRVETDNYVNQSLRELMRLLVSEEEGVVAVTAVEAVTVVGHEEAGTALGALLTGAGDLVALDL